MTDQHNEITVVIKFFEDEVDLCFEVPGNTIPELFYQLYVKHSLQTPVTLRFSLCAFVVLWLPWIFDRCLKHEIYFHH